MLCPILVSLILIVKCNEFRSYFRFKIYVGVSTTVDNQEFGNEPTANCSWHDHMSSLHEHMGAIHVTPTNAKTALLQLDSGILEVLACLITLLILIAVMCTIYKLNVRHFFSTHSMTAFSFS